MIAGNEPVLVHNCDFVGPQDHVALGINPRGNDFGAASAWACFCAPVLVHNCGTGPDGLIDLDKASESGQVIDPTDKGMQYEIAGRSLQQHSDLGKRGSSALKWQQTMPGKKSPQNCNAVGREILDEILTNPDAVANFGYGRIGGVWQDTLDVFLPNGMGARFDLDGNFSGFLD